MGRFDFDTTQPKKRTYEEQRQDKRRELAEELKINSAAAQRRKEAKEKLASAPKTKKVRKKASPEQKAIRSLYRQGRISRSERDIRMQRGGNPPGR